MRRLFEIKDFRINLKINSSQIRNYVPFKTIIIRKRKIIILLLLIKQISLQFYKIFQSFWCRNT